MRQQRRKRGGSRPGSGRKPVLAGFERLAVGGFCEEIWRGVSHDNAMSRVAKLIRPEKLRAFQEPIRKKAEKENRRPGLAELETAGKKAFGNNSRLYKLKLKRPYGGNTKKHIIRDAIKWASSEYQVTLSGDHGIEGQCVVWGEALDGTAHALLAEVETPEGDANGEAPQRAAAEKWLVDRLGTAAVSAKAIQADAKTASHAWATVRRAKRELGVKSLNCGKAGWFWQMPQTLTEQPDAHLKNSEHVSTCSGAHLNGSEHLAANVSTFPNQEAAA